MVRTGMIEYLYPTAWTAFESYPTFMETIETVTVAEDEHLHWVALVEDDTYEWDAEIAQHVSDESVTWRAIDGRETGEVRFEKLAAKMTSSRTTASGSTTPAGSRISSLSSTRPSGPGTSRPSGRR